MRILNAFSFTNNQIIMFTEAVQTISTKFLRLSAAFNSTKKHIFLANTQIMIFNDIITKVKCTCYRLIAIGLTTVFTAKNRNVIDFYRPFYM